MRLAVPNLDQDEQVHQAGLGVINLFGSDFFEVIDMALTESDGVAWLTNYRKSNLVYANYNFVDPSNLLKELLRVTTSPLRKPIRARIEQKEMIAFFDRLQVVLDDRNDWVHHNSTFSSEKLKSLILNIYPIASKFDLNLKIECDYLLSKLEGIEPDVPQADTPIVASTATNNDSELVKTIQSVLPQDELPIGELIDAKFIEFTYVLHLTGEIRDRKTNQLLSEVKGKDSEAIGGLLIARKPSGGRLRITSDGVIAAYFDDHWGYIARVQPDQWFPDHIRLTV
jgi:hypothetical protein